MSGRVVAKNMFGLVMFSPLLEEGEQGDQSWMNFHFYNGFIDRIFLSEEIDKKSIPEDGMVLSVAATLIDGEVIFKGVPSTYKSNVVCEERKLLF